MTAPITPDERADMRALADAATEGPWEVGDVYGLVAPTQIDGFVYPLRRAAAIERTVTDAEFIAAARTAVPRLLDALDTAEAEVERLLAERTAAHADDATCASCTHEYVADMERRVEEAEAKVARQRERLRSREEQVRRLRAEVTRLHALVADMRAATSPAWDEDTVRAEAIRAVVSVPATAPFSWQHAVDVILDVVRRHLPVRPDREDIYRAWHGTDDPWGGCADSASIERVLDLWPGESRADRIEKGN